MDQHEAKQEIISTHRNIAKAMRHIIDNLDKDARTEQPNQKTNAWRISQKERLEVLKEVYQLLKKPVYTFEQEIRGQERAARLAQLRTNPNVQTYANIGSDADVQEYIRLTKETS